MKRILASLAAIAFAVVSTQEAIASGRAACPGAESGPGWEEGVGVIATKATDMKGEVYAKGASRCTIQFHGKHKTAPYCMVTGPELFHIDAKVLRTSPKEVTFAFDPPLTGSTDDEASFTYTCVFKD